MNLDRWRVDEVSDRVAHAVAQHTEWEYNDQDGLNVILDSYCLYLDPKWNAQAPSLERNIVDHPVLIHFCGQDKPWHISSMNPYRELYWAHKQQTAWADEPPSHYLDPDDECLIDALTSRLPNGGTIAIYGCGLRGRRIYHYLREFHPNFSIQCFLDQNGPGDYEGVPIYRPFPEKLPDTLLLASVAFRDEILQSLAGSGLMSRTGGSIRVVG